jgi:hypothetical protein
VLVSYPSTFGDAACFLSSFLPASNTSSTQIVVVVVVVVVAKTLFFACDQNLLLTRNARGNRA